MFGVRISGLPAQAMAQEQDGQAEDEARQRQDQLAHESAVAADDPRGYLGPANIDSYHIFFHDEHLFAVTLKCT